MIITFAQYSIHDSLVNRDYHFQSVHLLIVARKYSGFSLLNIPVVLHGTALQAVSLYKVYYRSALPPLNRRIPRGSSDLPAPLQIFPYGMRFKARLSSMRLSVPVALRQGRLAVSLSVAVAQPRWTDEWDREFEPGRQPVTRRTSSRLLLQLRHLSPAMLAVGSTASRTRSRKA